MSSISPMVLQQIQFNPLNWFWTASDGRVYSSAKNNLIIPWDFAYVSFLNAQGGITPWPVDTLGKQTTAAMQVIMTPLGIILPFV